MDPLTISLLGSVLGKLALELITGACKDHLKDKLKTFFKRLDKVSDGKKVQLAYQNALAKAFASCLESLLLSIKSFHYSNEELKAYRESLEALSRTRKSLRNCWLPCSTLTTPPCRRRIGCESGGGRSKARSCRTTRSGGMSPSRFADRPRERSSCPTTCESCTALVTWRSCES